MRWVCTCVCVFARAREHVYTYARLCLDAKVCKHILLDVYSIIGCVCMAVSISFVFFFPKSNKISTSHHHNTFHAPYAKEFKTQNQSHPYPFHHNPSVTFMILVRQQTPNQAETLNFFTVIQYWLYFLKRWIAWTRWEISKHIERKWINKTGEASTARIREIYINTSVFFVHILSKMTNLRGIRFAVSLCRQNYRQ